MSNRDCIVLHGKILDRYFHIVKDKWSLDPKLWRDRMNLLLSLGFSKLDKNQLQKLLDADDNIFVQDLCGIDKHVDRDTKIMDDTFVLKSS
jgi:hypothetical protein